MGRPQPSWTTAAITDNLLLAILIIVAVTMILLFLFTGSIVHPLRAVLGNVVTLGATFGVMVWMFQDGHLSSVFGFTLSPMNYSMLVLSACVAFGLSMDYEVFLLGRIKEARDQGATSDHAVVTGVSKTGRIITSCAALLAVSFFAFATGGVSFIQLFGLATGLAILIDATIVRIVLEPAVMKLLGERSWYAPQVLRRIHAKVGIRDLLAADAGTRTGARRSLTPTDEHDTWGPCGRGPHVFVYAAIRDVPEEILRATFHM